ncbi:hypothetical protein QQP08_013665 [Theobroma cacao]|nr:hypothetical protein QQP08_012663 [Theobroma cacao]WRX21178.1 hypothetical protein QQP08_013665 [Theobroma cacao]
MAASAFSASSLFGSRINEPLTLMSSKSRYKLNSKRTPAVKISCDYSCLEVRVFIRMILLITAVAYTCLGNEFSEYDD